jgi:heat shock protein HslJ
LSALAAVPIGRLSLATLAGTVWVLHARDLNAAAESAPSVTLAYEKGRFTGTSGCNRYFAGAEGGAIPGAVKVGPLGGTRMACPEPIASVEGRFLEQLGAVRTFGFIAGRLALSYATADGSAGAMLFDPSAPKKP